MDRQEAIGLINSFAKAREPFLFIIDFLAENCDVIKLSDCTKSNIFYHVEGLSNISSNKLNNHSSIIFEKFPISYPVYLKGFDTIQENILQGNTYILNYAEATKINTNLSIQEIYNLSQAKYKLNYKGQFVCFSPESFIRIEDKKIYTYPMKGTIDADLPNAKTKVLADVKEKSEHFMIVDLLRNDLSMVAKNVQVKRFRYVEELKTNQKNLLQVSSEIVGDLPHNYKAQLGEILFKLLPAGSISGAPKKKTIEIIQTVESSQRGFYTGVFGLYDGKTLNSAVMIRYIEQSDQSLIFRSGGGITAKSKPTLEYQEMIDKVYLSL